MTRARNLRVDTRGLPEALIVVGANSGGAADSGGAQVNEGAENK